MIDEVDCWGYWWYPDLVRGIMEAKRFGINVVCLSGTTLSTSYQKEKDLWTKIMKCKLIDYNSGLDQ